MFDTPKDLAEKIRLGEDSTLELKEVRLVRGRLKDPHPDGLADELAAFANTSGGVCVLGVADKTRDVVGIPLDRLDHVEEMVRAVCSDRVKPPLLAHIERMILKDLAGDDKPVLKIEVSRSLFVHQSPRGYLFRLGSSKRPMPPEHLSRLFQQRSQTGLIRFDEQAVPTATLDDLDPALWRRFQTSRSGDDDVGFLTKLAMARADAAGTVRPTVAGVLMATRRPRDWLPGAFIQAVAYKGIGATPEPADAAYQLDARDIDGPLDEQIAEACRFVARNQRIAARKVIGRQDIPDFDLTAVFEAVVNAVAHRDYSIPSSKIRLRVFFDRLELFSPGALPNTLTVPSMPFRQVTRNEAVASLLAKCPVPDRIAGLDTDRAALIDRRGEGVGIILARTERLSGRLPEYRLIDDAELLLTIYAAKA